MTDRPAPKKKKPVPKAENAASDESLKQAVLKAALKDAPFDGFTDTVLTKAGKTAGVDKAQLARLFPDGPFSLIEYFSSSIDHAMEEKLAALDLPKLKVRNRIKAAVLTRLALLAPHKEAARRAAALMTLPMHAGLAAKMMYRTVDAMWRAAGDTSTDFNFYSKRGILAGVYGSTLVRWFTDTGEDEKATQDFLDARIENVMQFEKFKAKARETLSHIPAFAAWAAPKGKRD